jgi:5-methylcytosine-specific restriction enzyme subunit McrC
MQILYENINIPSELNFYIEDNISLHPYFDINFSGVKPKNYCGFISINNKSYFIAPKITTSKNQNQNIFIYMLIYSYDINIKNIDLSSSNSQYHNLLELFIKIFADTLLEELKRGVFKSYITLQENLKVLRGRYIIKENFSNFYHQNIYCEFDEFSMDNSLNHFLLYAISYLKKFSSYTNLYRCEMILDEVTSKHIDINKININFDRVSIRYKKSYDIALMLLKKLIPTTDKSNNLSFAFLFNMAEVFEKFVGKMYQEVDSSTKLQTKEFFGNLYLNPDIVTNNQIIDVKYKKMNKRGNLKPQDKYQMFVYGVNFGVRDTMLLYPKHLRDIDDNLELGKGEDLIRLNLRSLDLWFDGGYDEFIDEIRNQIKDIK